MSLPSEPSPAKSRSELTIIEACLDLIRWFLPLLQRLSRLHRFGFGDRLIGYLYRLFVQLVPAHDASAKLPNLVPIKVQIVVNQLQTRLLHQFQLIELKRYEHASHASCT
jgi:hypothetical protein